MITDPLIELLAIKLYEHDRCSPGGTVLRVLTQSESEPGWMSMPEEDRELYRAFARGEKPLPGSSTQVP